MKIPFLQKTVVALDVREKSVLWVEANWLGKNISRVGRGKVKRQEGDSLEATLTEISGEIHAEAYLLVCSFDDILIDIVIEDIPFFEESNEIEKWVSDQKEALKDNYKIPVRIQEHVIDVDEDHRRSFFQVVDEVKVDTYLTTLGRLGGVPTIITTGLTEAGYAQIFEEAFITGVSSIIGIKGEKKFLCTYRNGLLFNGHEIAGRNLQETISEADSYLRTEEASENVPQDSIPIFLQNSKGITAIESHISRDVVEASPLVSKTGFSELNSDFNLACGLIVKAIYPHLDGFDWATDEQKWIARQEMEKKESFRLSVLLYPPLIIIALFLFAVEGILDVKLTETNQVLEQMSDKIELVNSKTEKVNQATASYQQVKRLVDKRRNSARLFEMLNTTIPSQIWLNELEMSLDQDSQYHFELYGIAPKADLIADYMSQLENEDQVGSVGLINSEQLDANELDMPNLQIQRPVTRFHLRVGMVE